MSSVIPITVISLSLLALIAAVILFFIAKKFQVYEDPRIDDIQAILPAANCGGCGYAGCRNFAEALTSAESLENLSCPIGGEEVMKAAAIILGKSAPAVEPKVAVLLCNGTRENTTLTSYYDGARDCRIAHLLYSGEKGCSYGCLGIGDCVKACTFGAIRLDDVTGLPVIDDSKCTACGACARACPRNLIEIRRRAKKDRKIYVACSSCDKGGISRKVCKVSCIACNKCVQVCEAGAVSVDNYVAYIDASKCTFCRKCVTACPTGAIAEFNFPPKKVKAEMETADLN
jgi:electron transport complex protein RnfB